MKGIMTKKFIVDFSGRQIMDDFFFVEYFDVLYKYSIMNVWFKINMNIHYLLRTSNIGKQSEQN